MTLWGHGFYLALSIDTAVTNIDTVNQQLVALHGFLKRPTAAPFVHALREMVSIDNGGIDVMANLKEVFAIANRRSASNDSKTLVKTVLMAIAPSNATAA